MKRPISGEYEIDVDREAWALEDALLDLCKIYHPCVHGQCKTTRARVLSFRAAMQLKKALEAI